MDQNDLELLQTVPLYHLQAVLKARRITVAPHVFNASSPSNDLSATASTPVVLEVAHYLFDTTSLSELLQDLSELEILLLRELVLCGGRANSRDLALYFQSSGLPMGEKKDEAPLLSEQLSLGVSADSGLQPPRYPPAHPHGPFELAVRHLLLLGLVFWGRQTHFVGRDYSSGMHDGVLIVPQTLVNVTRRRWRFENAAILPASGVVEDEDGRLQAFQRTLYLYWSFVTAHGNLALVNNGLLARTSLRQIADFMAVPLDSDQLRLETDHPRLLFIRLLLMQLGLLSARQNMLLPEPAEAFFSLSVAERARRCYHAYVDTHFWNELIYLTDLNVRPAPDPLLPAHEEVLRARQQVIERILGEEPTEWHDLTAFIARVKLHVPYLLFPRRYGPRAERYSQGSNPYGWDFRLRRGWLTHREGWHMVEGGFIRTLLTGPLHWMGLLQIAPEKLAPAFALSRDAVVIMRDIPLSLSPLPASRLIVQPNFDVVVLAPISEGMLVRLDRFADRTSMEHIAQYRLSKSSVTRAIQHGERAETMIAVLEQAAEGDIPQNVRYSLDEWERQARRVEIWPQATLVEVDDAALLDRFFSDPELRSLFRRRLTPLMAEVGSAQLLAVQQLLWQQALLPAFSVAPDQGLLEASSLPLHEPQWTLHEDGRLEPVYAVLDFYVLTEVARFCVEDAETGWLRVTAQSLQRALDEDITLEHILRFLQHYCLHGIPGALVIRLKLWGGGYTHTQQIHVEHAPLLRLSDDVLRDLQADQEVASLLGSEIVDDQRLVHVSTENLAQLLELLRQRGFITMASDDQHVEKTGKTL
ncbi:helicase-associated domain-containing protein [Dictyobacter kobayashii]|uniref:Helicase XPB/Ssl2 N-terminal domain-containing protein n=1 Tax=Dictyobacter kobayashii TaxID=2014872 RepID=A0A402AK72_9CHLR|nr:helicase-associated domain-containing protein [Dictyobacter kobayashii]GCE19483.1 hypothetical protein KDK_32830 [Dictyobacter kobayashii]